MRIKCVHGYFLFDEQACGEIARFASMYNLDLVAKDDSYTFSFLKDAKHYSIAGNPYLGVNATHTFEGKPWDVMRQNGLVFDFASNIVKPIDTVKNTVTPFQSRNYFVVNGLVIPGSVMADGSRVTDYSAWFLFESMQFRYTEILSE